jgi:hypothetical protein
MNQTAGVHSTSTSIVMNGRFDFSQHRAFRDA